MSLTRPLFRLLQLVQAKQHTRCLHHMTYTRVTSLPQLTNAASSIGAVTHPTTTSPIQSPWLAVQYRFAQKGKAKAKKGKGLVTVDDEDLAEYVDMTKFRKDLDDVVEQLKHDFITNLAVKTNIGAFEKLQIRTVDGVFPLNQIASINQKSPTILIVNLKRTGKYIEDVMSTLLEKMNVNPQQEGQTTIVVTLSKVSREHREELSKKAKVMFNSSKAKFNKVYSVGVKLVNKSPEQDFKEHASAQLLHEKDVAVDKAKSLTDMKIKELLD